MKKLLFLLYVKWIRPRTERFFNNLFERIQPTRSVVWDMYKKLEMNEFSDVINAYKYAPDLLSGVVDHSFNNDNPNRFFDSLEHGRDCDNWARIWKLWGIENGYTAQEVILTTQQHVARDAHVVVVLSKNGVYWLMDYRPYGEYTNLNNAVESIVGHWKKYTPDNLIWTTYDSKE